MAQIVTVFWRDIPSQVTAKAGRKQAKVLLPERFQEAIDRAAMRGKLRDTDSYLEHWRRGAPQDCGEDLEAEAARVAAEIEAAYDDQRLRALVESGGAESD
ncbi:Virulence factor [Tistlia consotensis]|uniref:Virulence factor n=1 Tax=Tistlia consotensis USBA 355 TaxID=560819 RepID=A0A1Y6BM93_9PROT|nr:virulence factor [Tistlia consotensis]SMF17729.1 Virulence factor [Tistlia consotensis USBA 355]SNR40207.1 Virulence factor [Tistlia consotensis]